MLGGALLAAAWGLAGLVLASAEPATGRVGLFVVYLCLATALTWWAVELLVREWRGRVGRFRAARVSGIAALATLWLAYTGAALPYWAQVVRGVLTVFVPLFGLVLVARALIRRRGKNAPQPRAHDAQLAEKAFEARAAQKGYRG